ncbi:hypothetical protein AAW01_12170 [Aurantiacibacter gangjinensis]|uniref:DUF1838 domain-containing protein n=1 Tax=Aurantiacibacter gangjinensis TaxID=502682 RepID=A0A0G9MK53_9SPHN|nr:hypothetical protein AAW01_12170 [Aurantiacibacter gangjinensis]
MGAGLALTNAGALQASVTTEHSALPFALPATPRERIAGLMRLSAGIGTTSAYSNEGIIYGRSPGSLLRPLFGFVTVLEIRSEQTGPGEYVTVQKEAMVCIDIATRQPLTEWHNPYIDRTIVPLGYVSPDNRYYFSEQGSYMRSALPDDQAQRRLAELGVPQQSWHRSSEDVWVTERRYNRFPSAIGEEEFPEAYAGEIRESVDILTYRGRIADFADPDMDSVPSTITMMADTPWPLWMMMGRRAGGTVWHGFGGKYGSLSNMATATRAPIEAAYPGFLDDPWGFPAEAYGTAAQMRRLRAEGRM